MTDEIKWREVSKADTRYMRSFTCTSSPSPKNRGEIGVEHQVQAFFRQYAIAETNAAKDADLDGRLMIAEDSEGIAAAYSHRLLAPGEYPTELEIPAHCPVRDLCFLAVAERYRTRSDVLFGEAPRGTMADEAIDEALWDIKDRSPDAARIYATGFVDYRNTASMRMLARNHFNEISTGRPPPTGNNRLGLWMRILRQTAD
uniref:Uncharacterized protein n=1 Tax=Streptomyces sp. NBC_00049 TaxID=2903617 RepID=A0AAU2JYM7_9ACTN